MKVLIIQTAFVGDVVLITPLIHILKSVKENLEVDILVTPEGGNFLKGNPYIRKIIEYDKRGLHTGLTNYFKFIQSLKQNSYDICFLPHRSFRSATLALFSKIPKRVGFDKSSASFLYTKKVEYNKFKHEVDRNLDLLFSVLDEFSNNNIGQIIQFSYFPEFFETEKEIYTVKSFFDNKKLEDDDTIIAICPGSRWKTKRWLPERFGELAKRLVKEKNVKTIIIGKGGRSDIEEKFFESLNEQRIINGIGQFSIRETLVILSKCQIVISNDSAPLHFANAVETPVIALFGPTHPEFGFYPRRPKDRIIQKPLKCRPCSIHGSDSCPEQHFKCMNEISVQDVMDEIEKIMQ